MTLIQKLSLMLISLHLSLYAQEPTKTLGQRINELKKVKNPCLTVKHKSECVAIISEYHDMNVSAVELAAAEAKNKSTYAKATGVILAPWGAVAVMLRAASSDLVKMASPGLEAAIIRILNKNPAGNYATLNDYFFVEMISGEKGAQLLSQSAQYNSFIRIIVKPTSQEFFIPSHIKMSEVTLGHINNSLREGIFTGFDVAEKTIFEKSLKNGLQTVSKIDLTNYFDPKFHSSVSERAIARGIISKFKFRVGERTALYEALMGNMLVDSAVGGSKALGILGALGRLFISGTYTGWSNLSFKNRLMVSRSVQGVTTGALVIGGALLFSDYWMKDSVIELVTQINAACNSQSQVGCFVRYYQSNKEKISDKDLQKIYDAVITLSEG